MTWDPELDGVDHVNVYSKGRTWLGRMLSNFARTPFRHPAHGAFDSVEGFWYWLSCRDDRLRYVAGYPAKRLGRELGGEDWLDGEDFREEIRLALLSKLDQTPELWGALQDNHLPLAHYYAYGGKVVPVPGADWILDYLNTLGEL